MTRRKSSREFKIEAIRLVTYEEDQELIRGMSKAIRSGGSNGLRMNSPTNGGVAGAQAARDLDVAETVLRRWMRDGGPDCHWSEGRPNAATPASAFPGNGQMRGDLAEIAALKKEIARLRAERDILKKAAAFFVRV